MTNSTNKKNLVFPGNEDINYLYFLIEITYPGVGHVGAYMVDQAYTGRLSDRKEESLWNQVNASCHIKGARSGSVHTIRACGSLSWCLRHAREQGFPDML
jgi:hypothetical protein